MKRKVESSLKCAWPKETVNEIILEHDAPSGVISDFCISDHYHKPLSTYNQAAAGCVASM